MRRKVRTVAKLLLLALLLLAVAASAQDYKIHAKVDLVVVPVTVKGSGDKLISGLTQDDFVVLEDGRRQTITNFNIDPVPLSVVVLVDTALASRSLSKVQKTFSALAGAFSEYDEVAVYRYDKFVTKVLDFSEENERVDTALKMLRDVKPNTVLETNLQSGPFSVPGPVINGAPVVPPGQVGVITTSPPKVSNVLNDAIFAANSDLAKREIKRRRMVLLISDGESSGEDHSFDETVKALLQTGVQVYAIALDQPFPFKKVSVLDNYAKATGGDVYFVDSLQKIERAYSTATEEARNQYILGYMSNNEITGSDPVFRDIVVQVASSGMKTLHRRGYYQFP